ncbi:hypothetical protein ASE35_02575 [Lysobacter sp. Root916]|uniref:iron chaperone n=1 Tax=Lysobacter sp. Root916 TaxID=1736606 RepID=UPI00070E5816|nr:DUF1801 domain-containing protein [Lysobacter sp. Root916]KRD39269.1 hypothetical protein ASE35_02575 [Lysobacter sp. Root916]
MTAKKKAAASKIPSKAFSAEERAAMKERAKELKAQASKAESEKDLIAKIGEMPPADRAIAKKLHGIVTEVAPHLFPKTWYGMPGYANEDGKILCFLQAASKFGSRYATFGFNDVAQLDDGEMWPTAFALKSLDAAEEKKIRALLKKALG